MSGRDPQRVPQPLLSPEGRPTEERENHEEDLIGKATGSLARPRGAASTGKGDTLAVESNTGSFECLQFCHEAKEANKPKHAQAPLSQNYSIKLCQHFF